jgi:hypothetical protein
MLDRLGPAGYDEGVMSMDWFDVLKAARNVGSKGKGDSLKVFPFTAAQLADEAGFKATARSKATDIAAGWISKLVRWGYVRRVESPEGPARGVSGRPQGFYALTKWGVNKKAPKRKYWEGFEGLKKPKPKKASGSERIAANPRKTSV